ncbi:MAG TPA: TorF family putative porin [Pseudomonadales bacterium]|nr:TorF family putative porin [Pseudomonadales bacterium]
MKTLSKAVAVSVLMLAGSQAMSLELGAGFEGSANIGAVSNYMWRGMTQTRNGAAVQGGLDLTHSSGFYAGTWMSNVQFKLAPDAHTEQDLYAGYGFTAGDFAFDLKYTEYLYDNASGLNFSETHGQVSYAAGDIGTFAVGTDYSNNTPVVDSDSAIHYYGTYTNTLPADIGLTATVGTYDYKDAGWVGGNDSQYSYYNIGLNKTFWDINFGLAYTDSNVDDSNCEVFAGGNEYCGGAVVASAVKTFK